MTRKILEHIPARHQKQIISRCTLHQSMGRSDYVEGQVGDALPHAKLALEFRASQKLKHGLAKSSAFSLDNLIF